MSKHRRKSRKCQKGGDWYNPMSWFNNTNTNTYAPKKTLVESASDITGNVLHSAEDAISSAAAAGQTVLNDVTAKTETILNTNIPLTGETNNANASVGGKRGNRRTMKGGKGGLGLTYYATPVSNMNVVKPTYWEVYNQNGGSKRRSQRRIRTRKNKTRRTRH